MATRWLPEDDYALKMELLVYTCTWSLRTLDEMTARCPLQIDWLLVELNTLQMKLLRFDHNIQQM